MPPRQHLFSEQRPRFRGVDHWIRAERRSLASQAGPLNTAKTTHLQNNSLIAFVPESTTVYGLPCGPGNGVSRSIPKLR